MASIEDFDSDMDTEIPLYFPLSPFERTLLQGIQLQYAPQLNESTRRLSSLSSDQAIQILENPGLTQLFDSCGIEQFDVTSEQNTELGFTRLGSLKKYLFQNWMFTKQWRDAAEWDSGRSCAESYSSFIDLFYDLNDLFRAKLLEDANVHIRSRPRSCPLQKLIVLPAEYDDRIWDIMVGILLCRRTQLQNISKDSAWIADNTYFVCQVAQQFSLACRRPENGTLVDKHLTPLIKEATMKRVKKTISWEGPPRSGSFNDPRDCVELIPWSELEPVCGDALRDAHVPIHLPQLTGTAKEELGMNWMLWRPPSSYFFDSHCLYTEDEVYQYCIENNWYFPGHMYRDKVVFACHPLEDSLFADDFENFWERWNDCAFTVDPDHKLCLLETIPGRNYRLRRGTEFFDKSGGLYFRNIVEAHAHQQEGDTKLTALLGEKTFLKYQYMLRYLPPDQFTDIDSKELGRGVCGVVYKATWKPPAAYLASMQPRDTVPVVLKRIIPEYKARAMNMFLKELDMTFTATEGTLTGIIGFHGVTTFNSDKSRHDFEPRGEEYFLVFEMASEGNLLDFVVPRFKNATREESWSLVIDPLASIAGGLNQFQIRHIIHEDLHPGNVLVTMHHPLQEYRYFLADFGAGNYSEHPINCIDKSIESHTGFFIAPEVKAGNRGSIEADVYSLGCIGRNLIRLRKQYYKGESSEDKTVGPKALRKILDECLAIDPLKRPKTFPLMYELESLYVPGLIEDEETDAWEVWDDAWQLWNDEDENVSTCKPAASPASLTLANVKEMLELYGCL